MAHAIVSTYPVSLVRVLAVADPEFFREAEDQSSFIANAHNELCAFYTGKGGLLKKILRNRGQGGLLLDPHPFNLPLCACSEEL